MDLSNACRFCLSSIGNVHFVSEIDLRILNLLNFTLQFNLTETHVLLQNFCQRCKGHLDAVSELIATVEKTQANLDFYFASIPEPTGGGAGVDEIEIIDIENIDDIDGIEGIGNVDSIDAPDLVDIDNISDIDNIDDIEDIDNIKNVHEIDSIDEIELIDEIENFHQLGLGSSNGFSFGQPRSELPQPTIPSNVNYDEIMDSIKDAERVSYKNLNCFQCHFVGINIKALISHVSIVHHDYKTKWCAICNDVFDDVTVHKEKEHNEGELSCKFCPKKFTVNQNLVEHLLSHTKEKAKKKKVSTKKKKKENAAPEKKKETKGKLCNVCGKIFLTNSKLTRHLKSHSGEAPYKCPICRKQMKSSSHLRQHLNIHRASRPYTCKDCGKSFNQSSTLRAHKKLHSQKDVPCPLCDKTFCRNTDLKIHLRTHTGEKPFKCKTCDQSFVQKSHLTEHEKKHLVVKPYNCGFCDKTFAQKSTLKSHIDIHLGVKKFQCNRCPYAARQSYVLKTHMKQHEKLDSLMS